MAIDQQTHDDWDNCPQGELSRMVQRLDASQGRARTRKFYRAGLLSMLLVAGGIVLAGSLPGLLGQPEQQPGLQPGLQPGQSGAMLGGITCAECRSHFAIFQGHLAGTKQIEDADLAESMAAHLAQCKSCQQLFGQSYPGVLKAAVSMPVMGPVESRLLPVLAALRQPSLF